MISTFVQPWRHQYNIKVKYQEYWYASKGNRNKFWKSNLKVKWENLEKMFLAKKPAVLIKQFPSVYNVFYSEGQQSEYQSVSDETRKSSNSRLSVGNNIQSCFLFENVWTCKALNLGYCFFSSNHSILHAFDPSA